MTFADAEIEDYQPTQGEIARDQAANATRNREGAFTIVFTVDAKYEGLVHHGLKKFQKIARRHGQTLEITHERRFMRRIEKNRKGVPEQREYIRYGIEVPKFVGEKGQIVAHFERAEDGTSFYTHVFKEERRAEAESYMPKLGICEHCNTKRYRKDVFVCDTDEGVKVVGSTCLKDYLGIDPAWAIQALEFVRFAEASDDEWEERWSSYGDKTHHTDYLAQQCFRVAKMFGGYNRQVSDEMKKHLSLLLFGNRDPNKEARRSNAEILAKYNGPNGVWVFNPEFDRFALADFIDRMDGDFGSNCRIAASSEYVAYARTNLMLAAVGLFVGKLARIESAAERAAKLPPAKHVAAEPKARVDLVGTILRTAPFSSDFGGGLVIVTRCDGGENLVHFYTGNDKIEAGQRYCVRATVKKHQTDKKSGEPQTVVTRAIYSAPPIQKDLPI